MSTISVSNITTANGSENLVLGTGNTTGSKLIVNAAGGVNVNAQLFVYNSTDSALLELTGDSYQSIIRFNRYTTDVFGPALNFRKARGTVASPTVVSSGDEVGRSNYTAWNGTGWVAAAQISGYADTVSGTDIAGSIRFSTKTGAGVLTERMSIIPSGNVGIGTTTPSYKFEVSEAGDSTAAITSTTSGAGLLRLIAPNTALAAFNQVQSLSGGTVNWSLGGDGNENTLVVKTNATERMRVNTTAVAIITNVSITGGNLVVPTGNANFDSGVLFVDGTNNRVGVGTTSPDANLTVTGTANVSGLTRFGANVTMAGALQTISGNVNFDGGSVFVDATNNRLGVGTTSPDATFTVTGQANVSANVRFGANVTVVGNLNIASTLGNTGYVELNSGLKINWGVIAANSSTLGNATFSSAFATGPYSVTMAGANSLGNTCWSAGVNSTVVQVRSSNTSSTGGLVYYMAIGI
jgi:hypothetical protein